MFLGFRVLIYKLNQVNTKIFLQPNKRKGSKKPLANPWYYQVSMDLKYSTQGLYL